MLAYGFIPAIMLLIGGLLALFFKPGPAFRSAIQHFAAGLILSAMSLELLPQFVEDEHFDPHIQGFAAGMILAMLFQSLPRILIKDQANDTVLGKFLVRGLPIVFDGWSERCWSAVSARSSSPSRSASSRLSSAWPRRRPSFDSDDPASACWR